MNKIKKYLYIDRCISNNCYGVIGLICFHIIVSVCFLIFFFTVGTNLYSQVKILESDVKENSKVCAQVSDISEKKQVDSLLSNCDNAKYCIIGSLQNEDDYTIGWYYNNNLFNKDDNSFLSVNNELEDGVIVQSRISDEGKINELLEYCKNLCDIDGISAVIDSDTDSIFYYNQKDIYIPLSYVESCQKSDESYYLFDYQTYEQIVEELDELGVFVIESNSNLHSITNTVNFIKILLYFFGVIFSIIVSIQIVDLFGLLIEKNNGKIFMLSALGYYEGDIKKAICYLSIAEVFVGAIIGYGICKITSNIILMKSGNDTIFGVSIRALFTCDVMIIFPCIIISTICVLAYTLLSMRKLNGDNISLGLNEME